MAPSRITRRWSSTVITVPPASSVSTFVAHGPSLGSPEPFGQLMLPQPGVFARLHQQLAPGELFRATNGFRYAARASHRGGRLIPEPDYPVRTIHVQGRS